MSASFVHEFRNPLTSIMGFVKLLKADHPSLSYLDIISHELDQLNFRISQFYSYRKRKCGMNQKVFGLMTCFKILYSSYIRVWSMQMFRLKRICHIQFRLLVIGVKWDKYFKYINELNWRSWINERRTENYHWCIWRRSIDSNCNKNNGPMIPAENVETIFEPFVTTKS